MNTYTIPYVNSGLIYPIGDNMSEALIYIKNIAKKFKSLKISKGKILNIFCRGSSGAILAALFVSLVPNKVKIIHIKKEGESSHGTSTPFYFSRNDGLNIILDDFIDSGNTMNAIYKEFIKYDCGKDIDFLIVENGTSSNLRKLKFKPLNLITCRNS